MATKICPACGTEFGHNRRPSYLKDRTYCSPQCFSDAHSGINHPRHRARENKLCVVCGTAIVERDRSFTEFSEARYCSRACANKHSNGSREIRTKIPCPVCGKLFKPRKIRNGFQEVCSWTCRTEYDNFHHPVSSLERKLHNILDMLDVTYETQVTIKTRFIVDVRIGSVIIEADGDYWHGHPSREPLTLKQLKQQSRDKMRDNYLVAIGYKVVRIWESDMDINYVRQKLIECHILNPSSSSTPTNSD